MRSSRRKEKQAGSAIVEFAITASLLVPLLAYTFTIGMTLTKGIQAGNVCRNAAVLSVRQLSGEIDLSTPGGQSILIRTAQGLGMNISGSSLPNPSGKGVIILSRIVRVSDQECAKGVTPAPPAPVTWGPGNCPNYDQYAFASRIVIGNGTRWSSVFGSPPSSVVQTNGLISDGNIAMSTSNRATGFQGVVMTLMPSQFALVSEVNIDVAYLNLFSIAPTSQIYARNIS